MQRTLTSWRGGIIIAILLLSSLAYLTAPAFAAGPRWPAGGNNVDARAGRPPVGNLDASRPDTKPAAGAPAAPRLTSVPGEGGTRTMLYVPYINQMYDVDPSFNGACACGVASTAMVLAYYGRIAPRAMALGTPYLHTSQYGWALTDPNYSYGDTTFSREVAGCEGSAARFGGLYGALMVDDYNTLTGWQNLINAISAHGLGVTAYDGADVTYDMLKAAIDAGYPAIVATMGLTGYGHLVVVTGYTSDGRLIVNDSFGSKWAGYPNYEGAFVTYSLADFGAVRQAWVISGEGTGWAAEYYDAAGNGYVRYDGDLNFDWANQGPQGAPVNAQSFSARWTQVTTTEAGTWQLHVTMDGDLRVRVDDTVVLEHLDNGVPGVQTHTVPLKLGAGQHQFQIEYRHNVGDPAVVQFRVQR